MQRRVAVVLLLQVRLVVWAWAVRHRLLDLRLHQEALTLLREARLLHRDMQTMDLLHHKQALQLRHGDLHNPAMERLHHLKHLRKQVMRRLRWRHMDRLRVTMEDLRKAAMALHR